jgi:flagellar biosynthesis/type III secretory pathway protein FliH
MHSSADRIKLPVAPTGVHVSNGAFFAALGTAREEGRRAALAELEEFVAACRREVDAMRESMLDSAIEIASVLAEAVVQRELAADDDLSGVVRHCLAGTNEPTAACAVRVHPDALPALERSGLGARVTLRADADLARGEVRLDTPVGTLVHDPLAVLTQARDALLAELGAAR